MPAVTGSPLASAYGAYRGRDVVTAEQMPSRDGRRGPAATQCHRRWRARPLAIRRRASGVRPGKLGADKKRESAKNPAADPAAASAAAEALLSAHGVR